MTEVERLRQQAQRCLRLARQTSGALTEHLQALAADYLEEALSLERRQGLVHQQAPAQVHGQVQQRGHQLPPPIPGQQPMQQQQQPQPNRDDED
jgi:hypothetical protein